MATRTIGIGSPIKAKDEYGVTRDALVTQCWSDKIEYDDEKPVSICINLLFVSGDPQRLDQYGRQIERLCSVSHRSAVGDCPGRYWWQE